MFDHVHKPMHTACRIGPTPGGLKIGMPNVVTCSCGHVLRSREDLTWRQYAWLRRLNNRLEKDYAEMEPS